MKTLFFSVSLVLSGCALFIDMSPEGRHKMWVDQTQEIVGKNIFDCINSSPCYQYRKGGAFQRDSLLSNGNKEAEYLMPSRKNPQCRYFFEYEPVTGLIVGFRFVESEQFACAVIL